MPPQNIAPPITQIQLALADALGRPDEANDFILDAYYMLRRLAKLTSPEEFGGKPPAALFQPRAGSRLRYKSEAAFRGGNARPVAIKCDCGNLIAWNPGLDVVCGGCNTEYNSSGQRLAPRHLWEEEP